MRGSAAGAAGAQHETHNGHALANLEIPII